MPAEKAKYAIPFILDVIRTRAKPYAAVNATIAAPPFFLGINGIQGCGKSTLTCEKSSAALPTPVLPNCRNLALKRRVNENRELTAHALDQVASLRETFAAAPHNLTIAVLSLDDFYLTRRDQVELAAAHPANPLVQHRGQPSTHDLKLLRETIASLLLRQPTKLPSYDKSAHDGAGDRTDSSTWEQVNKPGYPQVDLVILEGWCVGFRFLHDVPDLQDKWQWAVKRERAGLGKGSQLGKMRIGDLRLVNDALKEYDDITDLFDAFIHLDALDTRFVYKWRLQAEVEMRAARGRGMTDEQVKSFVDGYYPSYELYTERLQAGVLDKPGRQLRLVLDEDRAIKLVEQI